MELGLKVRCWVRVECKGGLGVRSWRSQVRWNLHQIFAKVRDHPWGCEHEWVGVGCTGDGDLNGLEWDEIKGTDGWVEWDSGIGEGWVGGS